MRHQLLPILVLTAVAFSSSNLIIDSKSYKGYGNDNTVLTDDSDLFHKIVCDDDASDMNPETIAICNVIKVKNYINTDNNNVFKTLNGAISKDNENYNGKGFRKEQWHNYPRQLDRLQKFLYERDKRDDEKEINFEYGPEPTADYNVNEIYPEYRDSDSNEIGTNEILLPSNDDDTRDIYDTVVTSSNPLLILKIRLACLSNTLDTKLLKDRTATEDKPNIVPLLGHVDHKNPDEKLTKKENDWNSIQQSYFGDKRNVFKSLPSKKRIFSIWSRLQSLNPKGHELHHRRYLHAYYGGLPNADGGGAMSAETRAMSRPPGSPLRWG